ncbi:internal virion lysozyme motif [Ralstonia phage RSB3]|uniref:Internal virion protein n=1 Tax=Ralstonia phage RSB3 TaxID=1402875 RepID=U3TFN7_9CAUD|nr:internal virion lysozyme motif [Ralstonia phage RSB3]BAN92352.1 hypothetical protein [Ralstonia phage RSB3]
MAGVMRDAQTANFGSQQQVGVAQDRTQFVRPDYNKYAGTEGRVSTISTEHVGGLDALIGAIAPAMEKMGASMLKTSQEQAYLDGQAAAASGKAQEEVQSNIFTRDWATAGWADTKARLNLADAEAQTAVDMKKLREQSPEEFKSYLNERREKLMASMPGMSIEARKGMMASMLASDQSAIAKHMGEYSKFVVEQQSNAVTTSFSVANDALNAAKGDPIAYETASNNLMVNLFSNVLNNPNLPTATKQKLTLQAVQLALANNNETVYEKMRDTKGPGGVTMLDVLPFEDQVSLAKAYQTSKKDTATMRNSNYNTQLGLYESKLDNPLAEPVSWDEHQAFVQQGIQLGVISGDKQATLAKQWADGNAKKQANASLASAYAAGDIGAMFSLGKSEEDGAKAWVAAQSRKGIEPAQAVTALAQIGLTTGQDSSFKMVGKLMSSSVSLIGLSTEMQPSQLEGVNAVLGVIEQAEKKGNLSARTAFLSSFDDDTQARLLTYWDGLKQGKAPAVAQAEAATRATDNANLSKQDKAALGAQQSKENAELVASIEPKGLFAQFWEKAVPDLFRSNDNINRDKIRADKSWWENPERVEASQARGKVALLEELGDISRTHPYMTAETRQSLALSRVAARTVVTDGGPLVIPKGQSIQSFFGVDQSVSGDIVSSALNSMHTPGKGNRTVYTVTGTGQMQWQEYGPKGELMNGGGTFDPKSIASAVRAEQDKQTDEYAKTDGAGVVRKGQDGSQVRFNGNNTVGIGTRVALQIRDDLFRMENVRGTPYDDASGKVVNGKRVQTVGVGVSTTSDFYPKVGEDGKVPQSEIDRSFMLASNRAMKQANEAQQKLDPKQQGQAAMRLFTQLAYQGGNVPNDLIKAMAHGERANALSLLKSSPQYKMAHDDRKQFYEQMFNGIMPTN